MTIAILDYQAGNPVSVQRALAHLGHTSVVTDDPAQVIAAERVVFPGVGAAESCVATLRQRGLDQALRAVIAGDRPLLCICVGMQLLFDWSEEDGGTACLGLLPGWVLRFRPSAQAIKVPHMGWNAVEHRGDPLFTGIPDRSAFYFVHSYHCAPGDTVAGIAFADHGGRFCAGIRRGALAAVQFHPEKSGEHGLRLLDNFVRG